MHWTISYDIAINPDTKKSCDNEIVINTCIFILLDKYSEFQVEDAMSCVNNPQYSFIICKTKAEQKLTCEVIWKKKTDVLYTEQLKSSHISYYSESCGIDLLNAYKYNMKHYKKENLPIWLSYCIEKFQWKGNPTMAFFYKSQIDNQLNRLKLLNKTYIKN